ncbi:hypothetical protein JQ572_30405 [Bradyrhizobium japonicum]|nr:hypothetical protein [Bradyrhizobium japonicum]
MAEDLECAAARDADKRDPAGFGRSARSVRTWQRRHWRRWRRSFAPSPPIDGRLNAFARTRALVARDPDGSLDLEFPGASTKPSSLRNSCSNGPSTRPG